jgi:hypothetical protein
MSCDKRHICKPREARHHTRETRLSKPEQRLRQSMQYRCAYVLRLGPAESLRGHIVWETTKNHERLDRTLPRHRCPSLRGTGHGSAVYVKKSIDLPRALLLLCLRHTLTDCTNDVRVHRPTTPSQPVCAIQ